jgi:hypothetical protein
VRQRDGTDVGRGNGVYLAGLARRGHAGPVLGMDLSAGMRVMLPLFRCVMPSAI